MLQQGFLQEVVQGWLISSSPEAHSGDTTPWYTSFWQFCARYCDERFGSDWCISPEQSLLLHAEHTVIPAQVVIQSPKGKNHKLNLPYGTSFFDLQQKNFPADSELTWLQGIRVFRPAVALTKVGDVFLQRHALEARLILGQIPDAGDLLNKLLDEGQSTVAGRLAGAFRHVGRGAVADEIMQTMKSAGYDVREKNPFVRDSLAGVPAAPGKPPIVCRMESLWASMRGKILDVFPEAPGLPKVDLRYLRFVDLIYKSDAYHSLSIEGYNVSPQLIEKVRSGLWNPEEDTADRMLRDGLAARGYWQAFQSVKQSLSAALQGANAGKLVRAQHKEWYRQLFLPCIGAGLIKPSALAGYRNDAVYLRSSRYVPPRWEAVRDAMPMLFDLLETEPEPAVRAVLGHWFFGYIHPYPDGNGRVARFAMNVLLASGGYPWTIIRVEDRASYLSALEKASVENDIVPFASLLAERVKESCFFHFDEDDI